MAIRAPDGAKKKSGNFSPFWTILLQTISVIFVKGVGVPLIFIKVFLANDSLFRGLGGGRGTPLAEKIR